MELYIPNIPKGASLAEVHSAIRTELHRPAYSPSKLLNFHVRLFLDKHGRSRGMGILALPSRDVAFKFLREYGSNGIVVRRATLTFSVSKRPIDQTIQDRISHSPYIDNGPAEERERQTTLLRDSDVPFGKLQFGWECRDYKFSIEWEYSSRGSLTFIPDSRQIQLSANTGRNHILIPYSNLLYISTHMSPHDDEPVIYISCHTPPSFHQVSSDLNGYTIRLRRSALPLEDSVNGRQHSEIAPYCSLSIRLICTSRSGPSAFRRLLEEAGLKLTVNGDPYPAVRRDLWAADKLAAFRTWRGQLTFYNAYLVESLLSSMAVDPAELLNLQSAITKVIAEGKARGPRGKEYVAMVIRDFEQEAKGLYDGDITVATCFQQAKERCSHTGILTSRNDDGIFLCFHVTVTPTQILYGGPLPERSNRVIRSYPSVHHRHFVRVTFVGEGGAKNHYSRDYEFSSWIQNRIGPFLLNGITLAGRHFKFLAYSQSALKHHSVWFLRDFTYAGTLITVPHIIESLGDFDTELKRCPARYAARISQGLTTTDPTTTEVEDIRIIDDIIKRDLWTWKEWNFTDGVGTMSPEFARRIHHERQSRKKGVRLYMDDYPRALQIRFLGSKGVLSVDHTLTGRTVCLRRSMIKFTGTPSKKIEIAQVFDKPGIFYLNRPLVMILEGLGVQYSALKRYQDAAVKGVDESTSSMSRASVFLTSMGLGAVYRLPSILARLTKFGIPDLKDTFYTTAIQYARNDALREIKHKTRIPIPGAWNLVGVADVHGFLKEGEVFICIQETQTGPSKYFQGKVLVSRSPCIHPGDIQIAHAIGRPPRGSCFERESLANTLVFSTLGKRPLPSCLGGGDLDGDEYAVISLDEHPGLTINPFPPSDYNPAVRTLVNGECTQSDIARFIMDFIISDNLGYIAVTWRILADFKGIFDRDCLKLADLHSKAVDFAKSGTPVSTREVPDRPALLPDWHAPETMEFLDEDRYYRSEKAVGKLFRAVDLPATRTVVPTPRSRTSRSSKGNNDTSKLFKVAYDVPVHAWETCVSVWSKVAERLRGDPPYKVDMAAMLATFMTYRSQLQNICSLHTILRERGAMLREEEVLVGTIVANTSQPAKRQDHIGKVREESALLVNTVWEELMSSGDGDARLLMLYVAWRNCYQSDVFGAKSFSWIALGVCLQIMEEIDEGGLAESSGSSE